MNLPLIFLAACAVSAGGVAFGQAADHSTPRENPPQATEPTVESSPDPWAAIATGKTVLKASGGQTEATYHYRLVEPPPAAIADPGATVPLIVFLHGSGERGSDNRAQLKHFAGWSASAAMQDRQACYVLAMQCPQDETWAPIDLKGMREGDGTPKFATEPTRVMRAVMQAMDEVLTSKAVDRTRVYLTGLSMGGFGAFDLAARKPELFAAVVPICGGGDPATAATLARMPVCIVHGSDDPVVPVRLSRVMREAIAGAASEQAARERDRLAVDGEVLPMPKRAPNPEYREYEKTGHDAWTRAYGWGEGGVLGWMFAQRKASKDRQARLDWTRDHEDASKDRQATAS